MNKDKLALISSMAIFGTIGLVRRYIPCSSATIAFVRGFVGVIFLLVLMLVARKQLPWSEVRRNLPILIASGICLGANWIFLFEAYRYTSISVATICYYMAPVIVICLSPLLFQETITKKKALCATVAVSGMILVSGVLETGLSGLQGVLMGLCAACLYACVIILNKKIVNLGSNERSVFQLGVAALALFPYVLATENVTALELDSTAWVLLLLAGILHTGIAYALYFGSIGKIPAQTVALFSYIDPVIAVLLSAFFLQEPLGWTGALGVVMVISGALISELDTTKL